MRTSKHNNNQQHTSDDEAFERMYRTIPNQKAGASSTRDVRDNGARLDDSGLPYGEPQKPKWKRVLKKIIIVLAIILALTGLWVGWKLVANWVKIFGWKGITGVFNSTTLKGEDEGRVNILLAGNSADDPGHGGADLTDSIMIVSMNTKDKNGYILSIPRDLYVNIPGSGYAKINEAYQTGERSKFNESGYAEGGMGLLQKTVSTNFGVKLGYYALVNYSGLEQAVNAVGGVKITITSTDPRGLYDPSLDLSTRKALVKLPNGEVNLDGRAALNLSRARGNGRGSYGYAQSDFTRTEHQRKILVGLKEKAVSAGTLSNPIKLGQLMDSLGGNAKTDLEASEVRRLYDLSKDIPAESLKSASLNDANGKNLLQSYTTKSKQAALVPAAGIDDYTDIRLYLSGL
ncbi:MAG: LCP family protein [Candidatus Saccharimonadales bacterium]